MREDIGTTLVSFICCTAVVVMMTWFFMSAIMMVYRSNNCESYMKLTKTETVMIKGKCHKYVDGQLQIVKELE